MCAIVCGLATQIIPIAQGHRLAKDIVVTIHERNRLIPGVTVNRIAERQRELFDDRAVALEPSGNLDPAGDERLRVPLAVHCHQTPIGRLQPHRIGHRIDHVADKADDFTAMPVKRSPVHTPRCRHHEMAGKRGSTPFRKLNDRKFSLSKVRVVSKLNDITRRVSFS
jgi:hypothetical protein